MNRTFTYSDLLLLVYDELNGEEKDELQKAIRHDKELEQQYNEILLAKNCLDNMSKGPSPHVINNILNYSRALEVLDLGKQKNKMFILKN